MQKKHVAVIDIGSSKMTSFIGEKGVNKTFVVKGFKEVEYSGYLSGEFLELDETISVLKQMVDNIKVSGNDIKKVFVGVPGGFTRNLVRESQLAFTKKRKITEKEINALYDGGLKEDITGYTVINRSPILFELDDFRKTPDAFGELSATLKGRVSYVLCKDYFIKTVRETLDKNGISDIEFVSVPLAEALYLIDPQSRDRLAVLIDTGYISSTFTIIQGDGILYQRSFDNGGGLITSALSRYYDIEFEIAEKLKRKATISVNATETDSYEIVHGDRGLYFNKNEVKKVILDALDNLSQDIDDCIRNSRLELPEYVPLLITGGGIAYLRGANERLSTRLNAVVETVVPSVPLFDKPNNSSYLSVLNLALEQ
ncbi:MAG: pilus assembly protein PilM [Clostridia bacterium]|nr:pilus assembly protein PilM [Clostridia bacterium]